MSYEDNMRARWADALADYPLAGLEASAKMARTGLSEGRFLAGIDSRHISADQFVALCTTMGLAPEHLVPLMGRFDEASQVGFGFEAEGSRVVCKVYLEFWDLLVRELQADPHNISPRPLHLGLKWEPAGLGQVIAATYTCIPLLPIPGILQRIAARSEPGSVSLATVTEIVTRAAPKLANRDAFVYVETGEAGTDRRSYDLNLYKAGFRVGDIMDLLDGARAAYGLPEVVTRRLEVAAQRPLGHVGGGRGRDGGDYLTVYYEIDRLTP